MCAKQMKCIALGACITGLTTVAVAHADDVIARAVDCLSRSDFRIQRRGIQEMERLGAATEKAIPQLRKVMADDGGSFHFLAAMRALRDVGASSVSRKAAMTLRSATKLTGGQFDDSLAELMWSVPVESDTLALLRELIDADRLTEEQRVLVAVAALSLNASSDERLQLRVRSGLGSTSPVAERAMRLLFAPPIELGRGPNVRAELLQLIQHDGRRCERAAAILAVRWGKLAQSDLRVVRKARDAVLSTRKGSAKGAVIAFATAVISEDSADLDLALDACVFGEREIELGLDRVKQGALIIIADALVAPDHIQSIVGRAQHGPRPVRIGALRLLSFLGRRARDHSAQIRSIAEEASDSAVGATAVAAYCAMEDDMRLCKLRGEQNKIVRMLETSADDYLKELCRN